MKHNRILYVLLALLLCTQNHSNASYNLDSIKIQLNDIKIAAIPGTIIGIIGFLIGMYTYHWIKKHNEPYQYRGNKYQIYKKRTRVVGFVADNGAEIAQLLSKHLKEHYGIPDINEFSETSTLKPDHTYIVNMVNALRSASAQHKQDILSRPEIHISTKKIQNQFYSSLHLKIHLSTLTPGINSMYNAQMSDSVFKQNTNNLRLQ